jgi:hypothetical protein
MSEQDVINLMLDSKNENEWNANCDKTKASFEGQYPSFWYGAIVIGGVLSAAKQRHGW